MNLVIGTTTPIINTTLPYSHQYHGVMYQTGGAGTHLSRVRDHNLRNPLEKNYIFNDQTSHVLLHNAILKKIFPGGWKYSVVQFRAGDYMGSRAHPLRDEDVTPRFTFSMMGPGNRSWYAPYGGRLNQTLGFVRGYTCKKPERHGLLTMYTTEIALLYGAMFHYIKTLPLPVEGRTYANRFTNYMQPSVVIGYENTHPGKFREIVSLDGDPVNQHITVDSSKLKCYVAAEFDSPASWDMRARQIFNKIIVPTLRACGIEKEYVSAENMRNMFEYKPDMSRINPFENNLKMMKYAKRFEDMHTGIHRGGAISEST